MNQSSQLLRTTIYTRINGVMHVTAQGHGGGSKVIAPGGGISWVTVKCLGVSGGGSK